MTLKTRKPTGKPSWPILLIAGAEKAGKSWSCATASSSDLIGRTLWIGVGEDDPDEYGNIPGADFDIVEHDGTFRGILEAVKDAAAEKPGAKPNMLVVDSMTRLWELITADVQETANRRARVKAEKYRKPIPAEDVQITMDLWNVAKDRWDDVFDVLRAHNGPVLVTARLEQVTVMDDAGRPTTQKEWKVKANKALPFDVGGIVEMPERGKAYLRGLRSVAWQLEERTEIPGFTVDKFWRRMGLDTLELSPREHSGATVEKEPVRPLASVPDQPTTSTAAPAPEPQDWLTKVQAETDANALRGLYKTINTAGQMTEDLKEAIRVRGEWIVAEAAA